MKFVEQISTGVMDPIVVIWNSFVGAIPGVLAALVILILGYIVALIIGTIARGLVKLTRIDTWMTKHGKQEAIGGLTLSVVAGKMVKWLVFILFLIPAAEAINMGGLSPVLISFALWFPNLIIAVIITLVGLVLAHTFAEAVGKAKKLKGINGIKSIVRIVTLIVFLDIALRQIGIDVRFIESLMLVILAGIMIAVAIGFGLGLKPHAEDIIKGWRKKLK